MWHLEDIPDLRGRTAIVTGGNVGLGFVSSRLLAQQGARVVVACRDEAKGQAAVARLESAIPDAEVAHLPLDLVDPASIAAFSEAFGRFSDRLDLLLNNAGVVNLDTLQRSEAGHEMHMATNHLGHFALTGRLFPLLCATPEARVVTVSSAAYRQGEIRFDDFDWRERAYDRVKAYGDSKLANLLFTQTLQQRFEEAGASAISVAAHPGLTASERQQSIGIGGAVTRWLATPMEKGVRPQLRAAADPEVAGGAFFGPRVGLFGPAIELPAQPAFTDAALGKALWEHSETLTGVRF